MPLKRAIIQHCLAMFLWGCLLLGFAQPAIAIPIQQVPNPRQVYGGWVTDMAHLLNPETQRTLNQIIAKLERENGTEIAIVTVADTTPAATPKQFATELFKYWGIGKRNQNNGVLVLISQDDRRVEIETGYGIEPILSNAQVGQIIQQNILPHFRHQDFPAGVLSGTQALVTALKQPVAAPAITLTTPTSHSIQRIYHTNLTGLFWVLAALGFGLVGIVGRSLVFWRPTFVLPEGRSRTRLGRDHIICCQVCRQAMTALPPESVLEHLTLPEQIAQKLGSIRVDGWQCLTCQPQFSGSGLHLRVQVIDDYHFCLCPICAELTVEQTSNLVQSPTLQLPGLRRITEQCHCCDYWDEREETVPYRTSYSETWGDGSSDFGGGGGGSDFGGGDSGGGGDGGSW
ncbi:TPM domain-containing protein [Pantanalinema sp. GBBB05]|uniref:TPM domain-containing protein n=1 Tax=Pantanalinema sp. GBBB05 TaxID=2604139 RepID=UPI001D8733AC|nr:TPM domain-containing protein [Pantanalinema sp. GBBB05]